MPASQALLAEEIHGPFEIIGLSAELVYLFRDGRSSAIRAEIGSNTEPG